MTKPEPTGSAMEYVARERARDPALDRDVEEQLTQLRVVQELESLRLGRGLTQQQLADKIGISQERISRILAGTMNNLKLSTIVRVAMALGARVRVELETDDATTIETIARLDVGVPKLKKAGARSRAKKVKV